MRYTTLSTIPHQDYVHVQGESLGRDHDHEAICNANSQLFKLTVGGEDRTFSQNMSRSISWYGLRCGALGQVLILSEPAGIAAGEWCSLDRVIESSRLPT